MKNQFENPVSPQSSIESAQAHEKELIPIREINLLIHPGFFAMGMGPEIDYHLDSSQQNTEMAEYLTLLPKYLERANELKEDEIMIAFTYTGFPHLKDDVATDRVYTRFLKELREILGRRLIVLSESTNLWDGNDAANKVIEIARARGFDIKQDVSSKAFGEMLEACVKRVAYNFNESGGFHKPTELIASLTNYAIEKDFGMSVPTPRELNATHDNKDGDFVERLVIRD